MSAKGYIYFIKNEHNQVKIGFTRSKDITKRLKQLSTGSADKLEVLYYVEGDMNTEKYLHKMFSKDRIRNKGEWFLYSYHIKMWIMNDKIIKQNNIKSIENEISL